MLLFVYYKLIVLLLSVWQLILKSVALYQCISLGKPYVLMDTDIELKSRPMWIFMHLWVGTILIGLIGLYENKKERDVWVYPFQIQAHWIKRVLYLFLGMVIDNLDHFGTFSPFCSILINMMLVVFLLFFERQNNFRAIFIILSLPILFFLISYLVTYGTLLFESFLSTYFSNFRFGF